MNFKLIKIYIASHLASANTRLEEVNEPQPGLLVTIDDETSFFYASSENRNEFWEKYDGKVFYHTFNPTDRTFESKEISH
ncbi:hypothetical protein [Pediococcus claussenii]|uniref:Uncharacterized protein n=1 Tax=Pediococcus claussenii (strain ATCC BAA-344 / DSM 14800 / JCM 18046 / KCTC 3811 / LMG 21948 / P06) TaxID=701521 RepID=G8PC77_PEDCP|nr:hypothetical protein [Pediococcus claussenii]AEV96055.1 hypothetical protein PECL_1844 [Pediococcus claussenii ATCC BAA-344]ANZ69538.1 hypothetical protein AYR57_04075 [Pediococcus claussenii]ANZ71357.1 hypothetical protein AYR58_04090 [Pediococcus claussenii]KRN19421.1 hypothetical protein IV79_GL001473 [Pediococcus claussenii]